MLLRGRGLIILILFLFLVACTRQQSILSDFDGKMFENDQYDVALGFDLRNDNAPMAGLVINSQGVAVSSIHTIALPFSSSAVEVMQPLYSTWGSFSETTLVNYYLTPTTSGSFFVGITPQFTAPPEKYNYPDDIESSVAVVHIGTERVFVYRYPENDPRRPNWNKTEGALANTTIDAIGIKYPKNAIPIGIRDTQQTAIPTPFPYKNGNVRFYPANSITAGQNVLEIRYQLPPSIAQKQFLDFGVKLIAVTIIPLIQLIIKKPTNQKEKKQKYFFYFLFSLQVIILVGLVIFAFISWGESSIDALISLITTIIGGILAYYLLLRDNKVSS